MAGEKEITITLAPDEAEAVEWAVINAKGWPEGVLFSAMSAVKKVWKVKGFPKEKK